MGMFDASRQAQDAALAAPKPDLVKSPVDPDASPAIPEEQPEPLIMDFGRLWQAYVASADRPIIPSSEDDDPAERERYNDIFEAHVRGGPPESFDHVHAVRLRGTAAVFGARLAKAHRLLELGPPTRVGQFAQDEFDCDYQSYEADLRTPFALVDDCYDAVLCLEVLARVKDDPRSETTDEARLTFNYSGVMNVFREAYRVLRPGGSLLITTPNASSVDVIGRILLKQHAHIFEPHVRELTPNQVKAFGEYVGFRLETFGTFFAWQTIPEDLRQKIFGFLEANALDMANRGDDAYFAFRKPA